MSGPTSAVIGGVDTHKHTHHAAVTDEHGQLVGDREFSADANGHAQLVAWLRSHGDVTAVGVEGTGFYGAALTKHLTATGVRVLEVNRPNRAARRADGKSDQLDAEQAARAVLAHTATAIPKSKSGPVEVIRMLRVTRSSAVKARTQAKTQTDERRALAMSSAVRTESTRANTPRRSAAGRLGAWGRVSGSG